MNAFRVKRTIRDGSRLGDSPLVLLIEDSDADAKLIQQGLALGFPLVSTEVCKDGAAVLDRIRSSPPRCNKRPDLVILDLIMPSMDGFDLLAALKKDGDFRSIPVAVLSSVTDPEIVESAYANFANCYIQKPLEPEDFLVVVAGLARFWFRVAELPGTRKMMAAPGDEY